MEKNINFVEEEDLTVQKRKDLRNNIFFQYENEIFSNNNNTSENITKFQKFQKKVFEDQSIFFFYALYFF